MKLICVGRVVLSCLNEVDIMMMMKVHYPFLLFSTCFRFLCGTGRILRSKPEVNFCIFLLSTN